MIIDFHTHIFPDKIARRTIDLIAEKSDGHPFTDGTVEGLIEHMEKSDVDISVALPVLTKPTQFDSVFAFAAAVNERFSDKSRKIISFAGIHPECENIDAKMANIKKTGFKGVKIHPDYQNAYIDHDGYIEILSAAKEYDLIVVTHAGIDDGYKGEPVKCPPELIKKVIDKVKPDKLVLGHFGAHGQWERVYDLIAGENVYLDTAFTIHQIDGSLFKRIVSKHGEDKVLFATDCPWQSMEEYVKIFKGYGFSKQTEEKIFYKNAIKLLGING